MRKSRWWLYYPVLLGFTAFVLLDTFVIPRRYGSAEVSADSAAEPVSTAAVTQTENSYEDEHLRVELQEYRVEDTTVYVADITVLSGSGLQTALAEDTYGRNITETTSSIAAAHQAVVAVNGDYYGARNTGYVIRNGTLYRAQAGTDRQDLVIGSDGSFSFVQESEVTAQELLGSGAQQVFSFGPALVRNGSVCVTTGAEVGQSMQSNPRTAVGILGKDHYVLVVSDGRTAESAGLSLYELAGFLQSLGVQQGYNLDGGGSSTMVFCGRVVNQPTTTGNSIKERRVSDIVYFG